MIPILIIGGIAMIAVPLIMTRELMQNELLIIVIGIVALAYVLKIGK